LSGARISANLESRATIELVIPGRDEVANPEIHRAARTADEWIAGSMLRIAPE
jgi:hypothetical protein